MALSVDVFIKLSDDDNKLRWESVVVHQILDDLPVDAVNTWKSRKALYRGSASPVQ